MGNQIEIAHYLLNVRLQCDNHMNIAGCGPGNFKIEAPSQPPRLIRC